MDRPPASTTQDVRCTLGETEIASLVGRYYDPSTEQFLSVDPAVAATGTPYAFTGGDPVNGSDPDGLDGHCGANIFCYVGSGVDKLENVGALCVNLDLDSSS
jgi:hypothetical protein